MECRTRKLKYLTVVVIGFKSNIRHMGKSLQRCQRCRFGQSTIHAIRQQFIHRGNRCLYRGGCAIPDCAGAGLRIRSRSDRRNGVEVCGERSERHCDCAHLSIICEPSYEYLLYKHRAAQGYRVEQSAQSQYRDTNDKRRRCYQDGGNRSASRRSKRKKRGQSERVVQYQTNAA